MITESEIKRRIQRLEKDKKQDPNESYFYNQEIKKLKSELRRIKLQKAIKQTGKSISKAGKDYSKVVKGRRKTKKRFSAIPKLKGIPRTRSLYDNLDKPSKWGY